MRGFGVCFALVSILVLCASGCQDGYPIEATPCDRLCRAYEPAGCSEGPAQCVVGCEQSPYARPRCAAALDAMIRCLDGVPADEIGCSLELTPRCNAYLVDLYVCRGDLTP